MKGCDFMKVSFIIVVYNGLDYLIKCINSIKRYIKKLDYEIILVDNNSNNETKEYIKSQCLTNDKIKSVFNDKNFGFGKANNIGVRNCTGDVVVLMNSDVELVNSEIEDLIKKIYEEEKLIIAPRLINAEGIIQPSGQYFQSTIHRLIKLFRPGRFVRKNKILKKIVRNLFKENKVIQGYLQNENDINDYTDYDWICGAFMIMRKDIFNELNGFDENIFMYFEDYDLCRRAKEKNIVCRIYNRYKALHYIGKSSKLSYDSINFDSLFLWTESYLYVLNKYNENFRLFKILYSIKYFCMGIFNLIIFKVGRSKNYFKLSFKCFRIRFDTVLEHP